MPSIYHPQLNEANSLTGEEHHHLSRVLRAKIEDVVLLNDGKGSLAKAIIQSIDKKSAQFQLLDRAIYHEPSNLFAVAFSLLKNRHDELIVEKCTELGCMEFYPFISSYSVRKSDDVSRFQRIALSAIKQCDNPWLPLINPVQILKDSIDQVKQNGYIPIFCTEQRPDLWLHDLELPNGIKPCFFIGPEGGFSREELHFITQEKLPQISISKLVLRAETAAIAIAAQYISLHKPRDHKRNDVAHPSGDS